MKISKIIFIIASGKMDLFYKSTEWIHKRLNILKRDNRECQHCKANGLYSAANCVHHIKHLKNRPDLALVDSNLISLCNACHNEMHPEKLKNNKKKIINIEERW